MTELEIKHGTTTVETRDFWPSPPPTTVRRLERSAEREILIKHVVNKFYAYLEVGFFGWAESSGWFWGGEAENVLSEL